MPFSFLRTVGFVSAALLAATLFGQPSWTSRVSGTQANLWGAAVSPNAIVAVGEQGTILVSSDEGITWTKRDAGTDAWLTAVAYEPVDGRFYIVGDHGLILSSQDGIDWSREISPITVRLNGITVASGIVSVVGENGAGVLIRDRTGQWSREEAGFGDRWMRGIEGSVAVGQGGSFFVRRSASPSGNLWENLGTQSSFDLEAVAYGPTAVNSTDSFSYTPFTFTAVGAGGTILQRDENGAFVARNSGTSERLRGICYKGNQVSVGTITWVTVGEYFAVGSRGTLLRSADGLHWVAELLPGTADLNAVVSTSHTVVAVGNSGTIFQMGGSEAAPVIVHQPTTLSENGEIFATASSSGSGALSYLWLRTPRTAAGVVVSDGSWLVGDGQPRQSLGHFPLAENKRVFEFCVANAFGVVRSVRFTPHRFLNLSSRARVSSGENVLVGGFAVRGSSSALIRAVGPTLASFGVPDALRSPRISIFKGSQLIATGAAWGRSSEAERIRAAAERVGAFPLPESSADAALLLTVGPGGYTVHVESEDGSAGTALIEVYEVDLSPNGRLVNLSTRAYVPAKAGALIGGLVIDGGIKRPVLIRAAGPALAGFGIGDPLRQPKLTLFRGQEEIAVAENWSATSHAAQLRTAAKAVGAFEFPEDSRDAAMLIELEPGAYTVHVSGADGGEGVALVEVYEQPY